MTQKSKSSKVVTLILMILAMNTIYMLPYLMYTYYTPLQEAMGLIGRDADYGRLLNVYGIANVILYLPGGWVADKFDCIFHGFNRCSWSLGSNIPKLHNPVTDPYIICSNNRTYILVFFCKMCQHAR